MLSNAHNHVQAFRKATSHDASEEELLGWRRKGKDRMASQQPGRTAGALQQARHSWPRPASLARGPEGRGPQGNCWGQLSATEEPTS